VEQARRGSRQVWFDGAWHDTAIYARLDLPVGAVVAGPAILEQPDATTVIDPGLSAKVDDWGNLIVTRQ
jgi:N-methylhydantoinase A